MKLCKKCGLEKERTEFYKHIRSLDGLDSSCKDCKKIYQKNNSNHIKEQKKQYTIENKEKLKDYKSKYKKENPEKVKNSNKKYNEKIKKDSSKKRKYYKPKNTLYCVRKNIYGCISKSLNRNGYTKKSKTHEILGCSFDEFILYLESKFESWMNWGNKGLYNGDFNYGWDIDHIIPISTTTNEDEILKLNHYSNLQPLCSKINRDIKRDLIFY